MLVCLFRAIVNAIIEDANNNLRVGDYKPYPEFVFPSNLREADNGDDNNDDDGNVESLNNNNENEDDGDSGIIIISDDDNENEAGELVLPLIIPESPRSTRTLSTTTYSFSEECFICLSTIGWGGMSLHQNSHIIHMNCSINFLIHSRQIRWSHMTFTFNCPLCRFPVQGSILMDS